MNPLALKAHAGVPGSEDAAVGGLGPVWLAGAQPVREVGEVVIRMLVSCGRRLFPSGLNWASTRVIVYLPLLVIISTSVLASG